MAQASIWDRGTQLIILLMWQRAGQAGTLGMMQLALPEGQKRKADRDKGVISMATAREQHHAHRARREDKGEGRIKCRKHSQEIGKQGKMEVEEEQQSSLF